MLIGDAHVSKAAGSQSLDLQRVALQAAGVDADNVLPRRRVRRTRRPPKPQAEAEDHARERDTHSHNRSHFPGQASSTSAGRIFSWLRTLQLFATTPLGSEHFLQYSQHLGHGRGRKPSKPLR